MGRGVILSKTKSMEDPLPDSLKIYPPANPDYVSGTYDAVASIWYRDTTQTSTFTNTITMKKYKSGTVSLRLYANHGSGQTPYVRLDVLNANGSIKRNIYYSTTGGLGYTWYATVSINSSDIIDGRLVLRGTAFASVYSPDNPSWSVREIHITEIVLNK